MIEDIFQVQNNKAVYWSNFVELFNDLLLTNEGEFFEITIKKVKDKGQYYQHKWYRGYLLPAIARESFDGMLERAHYELKKVLLFEEIKSWEDIPKKHLCRCTPVFDKVINEATGLTIDKICGYIKSTATLTKKEFKEFIEDVERLIEDMGLQIGFDKEAQKIYDESHKEIK